MTEEEAKALLKRYNAGLCSPEEEMAISQWLDETGRGNHVLLSEEHEAAFLQQLDDKVAEGLGIQLDAEAGKDKKNGKVGFKKWWAVAASVLILAGSGAYLWQRLGNKKLVPDEIAKLTDIAPPASSHAVITLSNGQKIYLDSADNGTLAAQGSSKLVKLKSGDIEYENSGNAAMPALVYNTLSVPKGSRPVHITLSDGSQVWLNAASTLKYPATFAGNERSVAISGEGYFEVAHNPAMPFIVTKGDEQVKVLGTHFNVNAYDDESKFSVTLLQGSVDVSKSGSHEIIKPGQQANIEGSAIKISDDVDVDNVTAWKDNKFAFGGQDIDEIMRQISRWYNVDIVYQGKAPAVHFMGNLTRLQNVSQVLNVLEQTNAIHFKVETDKITVLP